MKIFPANVVSEIDRYTIENEPIPSIDLMERAASKLLNWYLRRYRPHRKVFVFAGPGNNGGDAIALARMLAERQYSVECYLVHPSENLSADCSLNLRRLEEQSLVKIFRIMESGDMPMMGESDIVIDGIFGSGLSRKIEGIYKEVIAVINRSRAEIISIDIPSGLFGEDNSENDPASIIMARHTLSFQFPFLSFFFRENQVYTGEWHVVDIGLHAGAIEERHTDYSTIQKEKVARKLPERNKFDHKGTYGHALIIAGSHGMMGAAVLTAEAALRSGTGLVTVHVPGAEYRILQSAFPEAIVSIDPDDESFSIPPDIEKYSALAVGPGLGTGKKVAGGLKLLLEIVSEPIVMDADALNIISENKELLNQIPQYSIITPHPLEFDRLAGTQANSWKRHEAQIQFSKKYQVIVVLKGAYTGISFPDGNYYFNTTGNPGMATGGSGDVLTGIIVSLMSQGLSPADAALSAVYLHGLAGDFAAEKFGQESMIAGDIIKCIGEAFKRIKYA